MDLKWKLIKKLADVSKIIYTNSRSSLLPKLVKGPAKSDKLQIDGETLTSSYFAAQVHPTGIKARSTNCKSGKCMHTTQSKAH